MAIDTKPNLSNEKFEQFSGETLSLSGTTEIYGKFHVADSAILSISPNAGAGRVLTSDGLGHATWQVPEVPPSGERISKCITQSSHGFNIQDVIGWSGGTYNKAIADGTYDGEVVGIVTNVDSPNIFEVTQAGYVTGLTGLVMNTTYFLSDVTAGLLTPNEPTGNTHISRAMLIADSVTSGWVLPYAGYIITTGDSGGGMWGTITGTLSDQTDLQNALNLKANCTDIIYNLTSPATCTVGGISPGYDLSGKSLMCILRDALAPYISPTFSAFNMSGTFPIEVGAAMSGNKTFTWSTTTPANIQSNSISISEVGGSVLSSGLPNTGSATVNIGTKTNNSPTTWTWRISGTSTQNTGFTRDVSKCSVYPYFWGVTTCGTRPAVTNALVTGGNKVVNAVGTAVSVTFNSNSQWTWFAMPANCAARTKWFVAVGNCGFIDRSVPSDRYPDSCVLTITCGSWSASYRVYMAGFADSISVPLEFRTY